MPLKRTCIVSGAQTKFGVLEGVTLREMFAEAVNRVTVDADIPKKDIQAVFVGSFIPEMLVHQGHTAPLLADFAGLRGLPATRHEAACASGATALRAGIMAIESGLYDVVLVAAAEKMTGVPTSKATEALAAAADDDFESGIGLTFPGVFGMAAVAHMQKYGTTEEDMALVAVKAHKNASTNPYAQFNKEITLEKALTPRYIAWPLKLFDCSPISDGAAAVVLTSADVAKKYTDTPVRIVGTGQASASMNISGRTELASFEASVKASKMAYDMARLGPKDMDFAVVHDCFTIAEIIASEDIGFFKPGEGAKAVRDGVTALDGDRPINPDGGLKAVGHPVGATGVKQAVVVYRELIGEAGKNQVANHTTGIQHNFGGTGATCVCNVFRRADA
ncbi:MAG: thiolase domain-containing protein [Candidatus Thorarchaeota archaeon]|nr:thiolase domain-containing protein [Candidatus Thorarchaeota archaeon]